MFRSNSIGLHHPCKKTRYPAAEMPSGVPHPAPCRIRFLFFPFLFSVLRSQRNLSAAPPAAFSSIPLTFRCCSGRIPARAEFHGSSLAVPRRSSADNAPNISAPAFCAQSRNDHVISILLRIHGDSSSPVSADKDNKGCVLPVTGDRFPQTDSVRNRTHAESHPLCAPG